MAAPARKINVFSGGMSGDVDDTLQPDGTYRDNRNFRLLYNTAVNQSEVTAPEEALNGKSLSLELIPGTVLATVFPAGYRALHKGTKSPFGLIVFLTNGENAEIGLIRNNPWTYQTLYSDTRDPNGDTLDLHAGDRLQAYVITENAGVCRIYWTDNVSGHGSRVLNLNLVFNEAGVPYHASASPYPKWLSVHNMDAQPVLDPPEVNFKKRIAGNLPSGAFQVTTRHRLKDGHDSPWSTLSPVLWVYDQTMPETDTPMNHHRRYMGAASVPTNEGLQYELSGIDTRWDEIEVALLYHSANVGVERARIVAILPATEHTRIIDITQFVGRAVTLESFRTSYQTLTRVGTLTSANNLMYQGDVDQQQPLTINNEKFKAEFTSFDFCADVTNEPKFTAMANPANPSRQDGDKLTNSPRETRSVSTQRFINRNGFPQLKEHLVVDDYVNFKGQLVQHLFRGYRRGETYNLGAVCRDDRGNQYFVQPLGEVRIPTLSEQPTSYYDQQKGRWLLRSLGLKLSGIRIPYEVAYYPSGKRRLSTIEIVRTDASGRLGFQGVIMPCTTNIPFNGVIEDDQRGKKVEPAIGWNNAYTLPYNAGTAGVGHRATHRSAVQTGDKVKDIRADDAANKAYWQQIHAPDVLIEEKLPELSPACRLQLVGTAHKSTLSNEIRLSLAAAKDGNRDASMMFYTKNYKVNGSIKQNGDSYGRPKMNDSTRIRTWFRNDSAELKLKENVDPDDPEITFGSAQNLHPFIGGDQINKTTQPAYRPPTQGVENRVDAILQLGAVIAKTQDWETTDVIESNSSYVSVHLVNFVQPPTNTAAADELIYVPTGYVLNTTDQVLDSMPFETDTAGNKRFLVLNGAEVYGGDTYVNLFDFAQLYPYWEINCNRRYGYTTDYGVGRIVPIESKYNLSMRAGRSLANNAFFPQAASCENEVPHSTGGIAWTQAEDWNISSVLIPKETLALYSPQPKGTVLVSDRIYSIYNTQPKLYGEREDSFRKQLVNDFVDLDGTKGRVMRLESVFGGVYCWQEFEYGRVRTYERGYVASSVGQLTTGAGKVLDGVEYSKQGLGLQQFNAFVADENRVYWIDGIRHSLCRFSQAGNDELSEREKAHDLFFVLLPKNGPMEDVELTTNPIHKEVLVSWSVRNRVDNSISRRGTLAYSEALDTVGGWYDQYPDKNLLFDNILLMTDPDNPHKLYEAGVGLPCHFFGKYYPAKLTWIVNPTPMYPKKFDNMFLSVSLAGRKALVKLDMVTENDRQALDLRDQVDSGVQFRRGRLMMPLLQEIEEDAEESMPRLWGKTLRLTLHADASLLEQGDRLTLLASDTIYRLINRI